MATFIGQNSIDFMRKIMFISALLISTVTLAQKIPASKVPDQAIAAFKKNFPKAGDAVWEKENGNYEVAFADNDKKISATFDEKGKWLETEFAIDESDLPKPALAYVDENYKGEKIKAAAKINVLGGSTNYEIEIKNVAFIFDANGKFIRSQKD